MNWRDFLTSGAPNFLAGCGVPRFCAIMPQSNGISLERQALT